MKRNTMLAALAAALLASAAPAAAQNPPADSMPVPAEIAPEAAVPRAAFIRALAVPGWGHLYLGETKRAAVYIALETTSWFMLLKTLHRLDDVADRRDHLTQLSRDSLAAEMAADTALARQLEDPERFEAALSSYPGLQNARSLTRAREQQRQDWITYTLVLTFASAVDAYVTGHLQNFPGDVTTSRAPDGGVSLGLRLPVGAAR